MISKILKIEGYNFHTSCGLTTLKESDIVAICDLSEPRLKSMKIDLSRDIEGFVKQLNGIVIKSPEIVNNGSLNQLNIFMIRKPRGRINEISNLQ